MLSITLLLVSLPARSTDYVAPYDGRSAVPLGCLTVFGITRCLLPITLIIGDTLTLGAGVTVLGSITSSTGNVTLGDNVQVFGEVFTSTGNIKMGVNGKVSGHVESSTGNIELGAGVVVGVNIYSTTGAITLGANATINDSIQSSTGPISLGPNGYVKKNVSSTTGALTVGQGGHVVGNIGATTGFISIGDQSRIDGSITHTEVGRINLGQSVIVAGSISSADTTTVVGDLSRINGSINNSSTGNVTLQKNVWVNGDVSVITGSAEIGYGSQVLGKVTATTGNVKLGAYARVVGIATATTGDIDIGDYGQVCGYVTVTTGAVTIGAHGRVGSYVTVTTGKVALGAVTVGDHGQIGAYIAVTTGAVTFGNFGQVGTYVSVTTGDTSKGAITFGDDGRVGGYIAITTGSLVTGLRFVSSDASLVISNACLVIAPPATSVTAAAAFDCLETGANASWDPQARKPLYTKLAGAPFTFDIAALKSNGALESNFVALGGAVRYLKVELFDYTSAACSAYATPVLAHTVAFAGGVISGMAGRTLSNAFTLPTVHQSMLCRVRECLDNSCSTFTSSAPSCSSDRFSVRPSAVTLGTTASMVAIVGTTGNMAAAPWPVALQTIKAGNAFTLFANTRAQDGYDGTLTLEPARLQTPLQGGHVQTGALTPSSLTANANAILATYDEAGYLHVGAGAYRDDAFTAGDRAAGDCISSTTNNANLADTLIGGQYGCSIGNLPMTLGRFIPDHFSTEIVAPGPVMTCPVGLVCPAGGPAGASGFIYSGQPFDITVTARSLAGKAMLNYGNALARAVVLEAWSAAGSIALRNPPLAPTGSTFSHAPSSVLASAFMLGVAKATPTYTFPYRYPAAALAAPTDIYLRAHEADAISETSDAVTSVRRAPLASVEAGIKVVSGRLHLANNYGSEMLAIPVVVKVQYWNGMRFVNSMTDDKTSFVASDVTRFNCKKSLLGGAQCMPLLINGAPPDGALQAIAMVNGTTRLMLGAPGKGKTGSVDLSINTFPWLPSTVARIGLGIYKAGPVIYMREMY